MKPIELPFLQASSEVFENSECAVFNIHRESRSETAPEILAVYRLDKVSPYESTCNREPVNCGFRD